MNHTETSLLEKFRSSISRILAEGYSLVSEYCNSAQEGEIVKNHEAGVSLVTHTQEQTIKFLQSIASLLSSVDSADANL